MEIFKTKRIWKCVRVESDETLVGYWIYHISVLITGVEIQIRYSTKLKDSTKRILIQHRQRFMYHQNDTNKHQSKYVERVAEITQNMIVHQATPNTKPIYNCSGKLYYKQRTAHFLRDWLDLEMFVLPQRILHAICTYIIM